MQTTLDKIRAVRENLRNKHSGLEEDVLSEDFWMRRYEYKGSNYANQSGHSSKFWEVRWEDGKITTRWGKIGTSGQKKVQHGSLYKASDMASKKSEKGYSLVKKDSTGEQKHAAKTKPKPAQAPKRTGRSVADLIAKASASTAPATINVVKPTAPKKVGTVTPMASKPKSKPAPKPKQATKTRLEYVGSNYKNQSGHSSKFYEVTVDGSKVTIRFGKIGTHGQTKVHQKGGEYSAMAFAKTQIAKKKAKGYKQV